MKFCKECGAPLNENSKFCKECGAVVKENKRFCKECGALLGSKATFCKECGAKVPLAENKSEMSQVFPNAVPPMQQGMDTEPVEEIQTKNKNHNVIIIVIIAVIIVGAIAAALILGQSKGKNGKKDDEQSSQTTIDESTAIETTTEETTTEAPTTEVPTTEEPTTETPTTEAPTTEAPTTEAPTTEAPTTDPPTTPAPVETTADYGFGVKSYLNNGGTTFYALSDDKEYYDKCLTITYSEGAYYFYLETERGGKIYSMNFSLSTDNIEYYVSYEGSQMEDSWGDLYDMAMTFEPDAIYLTLSCTYYSDNNSTGWTLDMYDMQFIPLFGE